MDAVTTSQIVFAVRKGIRIDPTRAEFAQARASLREDADRIRSDPRWAQSLKDNEGFIQRMERS